ncbi:immune inhibitor A domain-containing protein [uncultured Metabacillus sp.]|uniref:immune inhibitor A domain-containing protein n=1 Tax=uncultured Metabacillus sp. TaxID=2860135 RepID=UPI0026170DE2|nr:immune inhibitor A domain-containing protein [uncultured Metabacillus sp.]
MKQGKMIKTAMAVALGMSTVAFGAFTPVQKAAARAALEDATAPSLGATVDVSIANDERLIEMLKKEGKLAKNAKPSQAEKVLKEYLKSKEKAVTTKDKLPKPMKKLEGSKEKVKQGLKNGKGNKLGQAQSVALVVEEDYSGEVRKDKVLVLAIDFPDYQNSSITKEETDMFYENYPLSHFQDMIFGDKGYAGPNGENLVSMKQYYEKQSGGSYTVEGKVAGWYTADHPANYYGENVPAPDGNDARPRELVYEALTKAAKDPSINLTQYDQWDRDDYDGDGVYAEPDGIIDHLMVIHAGVGEEAGGGKLAGDAIWSHRSKLGTGPVAVPGATSESDRFDGLLGAWDYTIEPEDGAAGVFAHEYGHDLGLPDEYDTIYSGAGEPVAYWSIMSSGSWAGKIPGTEPTGFSPFAREFLQAAHGGNWLTGTTIDEKYITKEGTTLLLDEAVTKGVNNDAVRINLPDKKTVVNTPVSGKYEYFSGSGDELNHSMTTTVDLTNAANAQLTFKAWYDIETDWDYASVQVKEAGAGEWATVKGNITTDANPNEQNPGHGITGNSNGWVDAAFDLSAYAGKKIDVRFTYWTDVAVAMPGFYVDDIAIKADGNTLVSDNAEGASAFTLTGFKKDEGYFYSENYYLLEWRSHHDVDKGLAHISRGASLMKYDEGLVVWYVDKSFDNNWTGVHPGEGFLGVVDADQRANYWSDGSVGAARYQLHDAAFSLQKSSKMFLDYSSINGLTMKDNHTKRNPLFDDRKDYTNKGLVDAGRILPKEGLKFRVVGESRDGSVGKVLIYK